MPRQFPDPSFDYEQGLVAVGGDLKVETLVEAYSLGIFPWPQEGYPMLWFCPDKRGVLEFSNFHLPQRFQRNLKKMSGIEVTRNENFPAVIRACAEQKRKGQTGTWIHPEIIDAYIRLFKAGYAHSWEVWENEKLVGGGYGVMVQGIFSGESLFHHKTDMSKIALKKMVEDLSLEGLTWMDTQMVTPLLASFGAVEVSKLDYLKRLKIDQKPSQKSPKRNK